MIREEFSMPQPVVHESSKRGTAGLGARNKQGSSSRAGCSLADRCRAGLMPLLLLMLLIAAGLLGVRMIDASGLKARAWADIAGVRSQEGGPSSLLTMRRGDSTGLRNSVAACEKLVKLNPTDVSAHVKLGDAYARMERTQEAMASYQEALALDPNNFDAHLGLGKAYLGQGSYAEAIASCRKALQIRPRAADAHLSLGLALSSAGKYDEAMQAFQKAKELDPGVVETQVMTGQAYFKAGMYAQAIESFKDAVQADQEHAQAYFNLGRAYLSVGDKALALEQQRVLQNLDPRLANQLLDLINQ